MIRVIGISREWRKHNMEATSINLVEVREKKKVLEESISKMLNDFILETKAVVETINIDVRYLRSLNPTNQKKQPYIIGVYIVAGYEL
jgi:hypothetical protein